MSKKQNNVIQKMENTTMKNNATINNRDPDWANNVRKHPIHGPPEPVRAIRNIMKNHREDKITNAQRNAELNTRQRYNKKKRVRMFTDKELKARVKAKKEKGKCYVVTLDFARKKGFTFPELIGLYRQKRIHDNR